ncbi:MAG: PQQ-dependent sugar dehydrogenase [Thermomicrobiales bacterium]
MTVSTPLTGWQEKYSSAELGPLEKVAGGFNFPSSLAFDDEGNAYIGETGIGFGKTERGGKVWKLTPDGEKTLLVEGLGHPLTGVTFHDGSLWVSQGSNPGRITRVELDGTWKDVLNNLPGGGNYHTGEVAFGPDGKMYWGQGAMTNTGIVGLDALIMGWLKKLPHSVDIPGYDIKLNDVRVETIDPFKKDDPDARLITGPFSQFGETVEQDTVVKAGNPATSAIHRANPDGTGIEMVAWGIRNAFGLRFMPDGRLLAMDQGADDRGSRPVANVPDYLWEVKEGKWYGWPDFMGADPITSDRFIPLTGDRPTFIIANHDELPEREAPLVEFETHTASTKFDIDPSSNGEILVAALFGDETPMTAAAGHPTVGRALVLVRTSDWKQHILLTEGMHRPIDVRFNPKDGSLWIVDFGAFEMEGRSSGVEVVSEAASGGVYRLAKLPAFPADAE